jgi:hypothetical protein
MEAKSGLGHFWGGQEDLRKICESKYVFGMTKSENMRVDDEIQEALSLA